MLNGTITKNKERNGFELRLHENVDRKVWKYLVDQMGMNWVYSNTEKTADGKKQVILYRSFDLSKPQNHKGTKFGQKKNLKYSPEEAYNLLIEKTGSKAKKIKTDKAVKTENAKADKPVDLSKLTKAQLIELLQSMNG